MAKTLKGANISEHFNPFRSVRWRYDRLLELIENGSRVYATSPGLDDDYICTAHTFLLQWKKAAKAKTPKMTDTQRKKLWPIYPGLYLAYNMFLQADEDVRLRVEARILARQTDEEIAAKFGFTPETVEWYEALFFSVRERIDNTDYISSKVISPAAVRGLAAPSLDMSAKFFGYFGGTIVLEHILTGYNSGIVVPDDPKELNEYYNKHVISQVSRRAAEAINLLNVNSFNVMSLLDVHARIMEMQERARTEATEKTVFDSNIKTLLSSIPWSVGRKREARLNESPLKKFTGHQAELRADEMTMIAAGEVPSSVEGLAGMQLPPPRTKEKNENTIQGS